jgi:hypothetical protein
MKYSKEEKAMWLEDWRVSGKSANAYAKENGLIPWTFTKWTKEEAVVSKGFTEVPMLAMAFQQTLEVVIERGELRIHIPATLSSAQMQNIIEGLRKTL